MHIGLMNVILLRSD